MLRFRTAWHHGRQGGIHGRENTTMPANAMPFNSFQNFGRACLCGHFSLFSYQYPSLKLLSGTAKDKLLAVWNSHNLLGLRTFSLSAARTAVRLEGSTVNVANFCHPLWVHFQAAALPRGTPKLYSGSDDENYRIQLHCD